MQGESFEHGCEVFTLFRISKGYKVRSFCWFAVGPEGAHLVGSE